MRARDRRGAGGARAIDARCAGALVWVFAIPLWNGCSLPVNGLEEALTDDGGPGAPGPGDGDGGAGPDPGADASSGPDGTIPDGGTPDDDGGDASTPDSGDEGDDGADGADAAEGGAITDAPADGDEGAGEAGDAGPIGAGAPSFVQMAFAIPPNTRKSTVTLSLPNPQVAGDLLVAVVGWNDSTALASAVTDSAGDRFALAVGPTVYPNLLSQSIYYASNVAGAASNTVSVSFDSPALDPDIRILEYRGLDPVNPFDVATGMLGKGTTMSAGPLATTAPGLLLAATTVETFTGAPTAEWTVRIITQPNGDMAADRVVSSPGSYSGTASLTSSGEWVMQLVAFRTP